MLICIVPCHWSLLNRACDAAAIACLTMNLAVCYNATFGKFPLSLQLLMLTAGLRPSRVPKHMHGKELSHPSSDLHGPESAQGAMVGGKRAAVTTAVIRLVLVCRTVSGYISLILGFAGFVQERLKQNDLPKVPTLQPCQGWISRPEMDPLGTIACSTGRWKLRGDQAWGGGKVHVYCAYSNLPLFMLHPPLLLWTS